MVAAAAGVFRYAQTILPSSEWYRPIVLLENDQDLFRLDCRIIGQVHDSIMFECNDYVAEDATAKIKSVMDNLAPVVKRKFGFNFSVPVLGDVAVVSHWGGE